MNTWLLHRDLPVLSDSAQDTVIRELAAELHKRRNDSVDIFVLSPELELVLHQRESDLPHREFLTLLQGAAATVKGKPLEGEAALKLVGEPLRWLDSKQLNVELTNAHQVMEVSDEFRAPGDGYQDYTPVEIDATPFENGGTLVINIEVGGGEATGSFDLFDADTELPTEGIPDDALAHAWDIPPDATGQIVHRFARGQRFVFGATGNWFSEKGSVNEFCVRFSIVPGTGS